MSVLVDDLKIDEKFFYGIREVLLIDIKPSFYYAKIKYLDNNDTAVVNMRALKNKKASNTSLSMNLFMGGK